MRLSFWRSPCCTWRDGERGAVRDGGECLMCSRCIEVSARMHTPRSIADCTGCTAHTAARGSPPSPSRNLLSPPSHSGLELRSGRAARRFRFPSTHPPTEKRNLSGIMSKTHRSFCAARAATRRSNPATGTWSRDIAHALLTRNAKGGSGAFTPSHPSCLKYGG